jgi:hypothetical protein
LFAGRRIPRSQSNKGPAWASEETDNNETAEIAATRISDFARNIF